MFICEQCGFEATSGAARASHIRWNHPIEVGTDGPNVEAMRRTLVQLELLGRFEEVDAARKQSLMSLAAAVDARPNNAPLWREYRETLNEVLRADEDADDELAAALAKIGSAT